MHLFLTFHLTNAVFTYPTLLCMLVLSLGLSRIDGSSFGCILPEDYIIVVFRYGMAQELLWRVSWALNVIGHNVVDLSDFDWLTAIRRQRREM